MQFSLYRLASSYSNHTNGFHTTIKTMTLTNNNAWGRRCY
ncbi:hypothetical protein PSAB6_10397 [Paraburkholderia sabiae]|nr:hypothetical protein PSAB6_10397 [Paraburkholderia sabiae]